MLSNTTVGKEQALPLGEEGADVSFASAAVFFQLQEKETYADTWGEKGERSCKGSWYRDRTVMDSTLGSDLIYSMCYCYSIILLPIVFLSEVV